MDAKNRNRKEAFLNKQATLEHTRKVLKHEFIGIDRIIDEVIDNVSSWYFLPDMQEKPIVVNLWGLTGVGKTSLVSRLTELIGFGDSFYRFDLGEKEGSFSFRDSLYDLCENNDSSPVIIALDEFQHSRTVTGPFRQEVENDKNRMIWKLFDADEFNKLSRRITVPQIKNALRFRLWREQIARLGNIHIIYPALNKDSYQKIIENELNRYRKDLSTTLKTEIDFDRSINEIIYSEGVYPTQGVRPIFTTIHQVLKSKISFFYAQIFLKSLHIDGLYLKVQGKKLICEYHKNGETISRSQVNVITTLEDVRKNKKDDLQAITAVHESGHTVLSLVLMNTIPEVVYSVTTDADSMGFIYSNFGWRYISRKEILPRVAMMLGGYVAEELIFGKENVTSGASGDIEKATEFLSDMYKNSGMGTLPIKYSLPIKEANDAYHQINEIENEIRMAVEEARRLAESTLKREMRLLLSLSGYLSDYRMLRKPEIKRIASDTLSGKVDFIKNGDFLFYREHLKQQIRSYEVPVSSNPYFENAVSFNRDRD